MKSSFLAVGVATMFLVAGCILNDELTTMVIRPDGSADWFCFRSNIRSSEKAQKGAQELLKVIEDFEARRGGDFDRIAQAGGEILDARWVRQEEPYSTVVTARFPTAAAVERFWTFKNDDGKVLVEGRFSIDHNRRRLSMTLPGTTDQASKENNPPSLQEIRQQQANGIAETRIVVADGEIVAAEGFVVANDKHSCLLDLQRIDELLRHASGKVELFIEWEINVDQNK